MTPFCSGISPKSVAMPASTHTEPRRLVQRTLTKSRGPTRLPAASAANSWVMTVSFPIFCRICWDARNQSHYSTMRWGGEPPQLATPTAATLPAGPPHLDLLDTGVPLAHGLHALHKLFIKPLHGLVHHHLQPEHLAHIWDHFTQHLVPILLLQGKRRPKVKVREKYPQPSTCRQCQPRQEGNSQENAKLSLWKPRTISD